MVPAWLSGVHGSPSWKIISRPTAQLSFPTYCAHTWASTVYPPVNPEIARITGLHPESGKPSSRSRNQQIIQFLWSIRALPSTEAKSVFISQAIEIRGFRLTPPFPLAYDGNRANNTE